MAFLCTDRSIQLHAKFGYYYKTRIPRAGRDLAYLPASADLIAVGSSSEIYR
jgi:ribosome biogenesis protein ENP2